MRRAEYLMRDPRFVAQHRGGLLDRARHRRLAAWAADCAEHVLPLYESVRKDDRPRRAIETARAWSRGDVPVGAAQKASVAAHAAARAAKHPAAIAAARAAGHAVATAHMAEHALGAALYGLKAAAVSGRADAEEAWQLQRVPRGMRRLVLSGLAAKRPRAKY